MEGHIFKELACCPMKQLFLCIQVLLIFPSVPPAVIGHLAKGRDLGFSCIAHFGLLTFALLPLCVMERTKLCWAGRQETCLLCASTAIGRLSKGATETAAVSEQNNRLKILLFLLCFFNLYLQQAININLILYKALEGQIILDFKAISRPVRH